MLTVITKRVIENTKNMFEKGKKSKIKNLKCVFEKQTNFFKKKQEESETVIKTALVVRSLNE